MMWASSKDYVDLTMGLDSTGASTPSGIRTSTYERDDYKAFLMPRRLSTRSRVQSLNWKATLQGKPIPGDSRIQRAWRLYDRANGRLHRRRH